MVKEETSFWELSPAAFVVPAIIVTCIYLFGLYLAGYLEWGWAIGGAALILLGSAAIGRPVRVGLVRDEIVWSKGRKNSRIAIDEIQLVALTWAPKLDVYLLISDGTTDIAVHELGDPSLEFRRNLGGRLRSARPDLRLSAKLRALLDE